VPANLNRIAPQVNEKDTGHLQWLPLERVPKNPRVRPIKWLLRIRLSGLARKEGLMKYDASKERPKILVLILSSDRDPWNRIQISGQDSTFVRDRPSEETYCRYFAEKNAKTSFSTELIIQLKRLQHAVSGLPVRSKLAQALKKGFSSSRVGDLFLHRAYSTANKGLRPIPITRDGYINGVRSIFTGSPERSNLIGLKTLLAFQFVIKNYEFDYIFRTNTSSFINYEALQSVSRNLGSQNVYAGSKVEIFGTDEFASGAGILMSRDVLERICENPKQWRLGLPDDAAIGNIVGSLRNPIVQRLDFPRLHAQSIEEASALNPKELKRWPHIRCKCDSPDETIRVMNLLWSMARGGIN